MHLNFEFISGLCIFRNLVLLTIHLHDCHIQSCDVGSVTHSLTS